MEKILAKPFPGTVIQQVILPLLLFFNELVTPLEKDIHVNQEVRTIYGAITTLIDIRIGIFSKELIAGSIVSFERSRLVQGINNGRPHTWMALPSQVDRALKNKPFTRIVDMQLVDSAEA